MRRRDGGYTGRRVEGREGETERGEEKGEKKKRIKKCEDSIRKGKGARKEIRLRRCVQEKSPLFFVHVYIQRLRSVRVNNLI
jgi:hypothetical protein